MPCAGRAPPCGPARSTCAAWVWPRPPPAEAPTAVRRLACAPARAAPRRACVLLPARRRVRRRGKPAAMAGRPATAQRWARQARRAAAASRWCPSRTCWTTTRAATWPGMPGARATKTSNSSRAQPCRRRAPRAAAPGRRARPPRRLPRRAAGPASGTAVSGRARGAAADVPGGGAAHAVPGPGARGRHAAAPGPAARRPGAPQSRPQACRPATTPPGLAAADRQSLVGLPAAALLRCTSTSRPVSAVAPHP